jgi:hypothetical protein
MAMAAQRKYFESSEEQRLLAVRAVEAVKEAFDSRDFHNALGYFNWHYKRTGTLWEGRYRATVVEAENYLVECMRYIELNPVRAGMVAHPRDYAWSSYRANAEGRMDALGQCPFLIPPAGTARGRAPIGVPCIGQGAIGCADH